MDKHISTPLTDDAIKGLRAGDEVRITGTIYTARDAAHKKLVELLEAGQPLPFDPTGQIIYYTGPTPAPPGRPIGSWALLATYVKACEVVAFPELGTEAVHKLTVENFPVSVFCDCQGSIYSPYL